MNETAPAVDCMHERVLTGTTLERCIGCGATWPLYPTAAEAIAACRAVLRQGEREEQGA